MPRRLLDLIGQLPKERLVPSRRGVLLNAVIALFELGHALLVLLRLLTQLLLGDATGHVEKLRAEGFLVSLAHQRSVLLGRRGGRCVHAGDDVVELADLLRLGVEHALERAVALLRGCQFVAQFLGTIRHRRGSY